MGEEGEEEGEEQEAGTGPSFVYLFVFIKELRHTVAAWGREPRVGDRQRWDPLFVRPLGYFQIP